MPATPTQYLASGEALDYRGGTIDITDRKPAWQVAGSRGARVARAVLVGSSASIAFKVSDGGDLAVNEIVAQGTIGSLVKSEGAGGNVLAADVDVDTVDEYAFWGAGDGAHVVRRFRVRTGSLHQTVVRYHQRVRVFGEDWHISDTVDRDAVKSTVGRFHNTWTHLVRFGTSDDPCRGWVWAGPPAYDEVLASDSAELFRVESGHLLGSIGLSAGLAECVLDDVTIDARSFGLNGNIALEVRNVGYQGRCYPKIRARNCKFYGRVTARFEERVNCTLDDQPLADVSPERLTMLIGATTDNTKNPAIVAAALTTLGLAGVMGWVEFDFNGHTAAGKVELAKRCRADGRKFRFRISPDTGCYTTPENTIAQVDAIDATLGPYLDPDDKIACVGNEPTQPKYGHTKGKCWDATEYTLRFALPAAKRLRELGYKVIFTAHSVTGNNNPPGSVDWHAFAETQFKLGIGPYIDFLAIQPYQNKAVAHTRYYDRIKTLAAKYVPRPLPFIITEWALSGVTGEAYVKELRELERLCRERGDVAEVYYFHLERHGDTGTPLVDADGTPTEYGRCVASFSGSAPPAPAKPSLTIKGGVKVEVSADGKRWHYTFQASALPPGTDRVLLNIAGKHQNAKGVPYVCTAANGWRALGDLRVELEWQKVVEVTAAAVDAAGTPLGGFASRLRVDGKSIKAPDAK